MTLMAIARKDAEGNIADDILVIDLPAVPAIGERIGFQTEDERMMEYYDVQHIVWLPHVPPEQARVMVFVTEIAAEEDD